MIIDDEWGMTNRDESHLGLILDEQLEWRNGGSAGIGQLECPFARVGQLGILEDNLGDVTVDDDLE